MGSTPSCPQAQQPRSPVYKRTYSLRLVDVSRRNQASREPEEVTNKDKATLGLLETQGLWKFRPNR